MRPKFELRKSTDPDTIMWECVSGHGCHYGQAITPGSTISLNRWFFWIRSGLNIDKK